MTYISEHGFGHKNYRERHEAEKQIRVYYVPAYDKKQEKMAYFYLVASALLHERVIDAINHGVVPDFAVIVERGYGEPSAEVKARVKEYYGFDHDAVLSAANSNIKPTHTGSATLN